MVENIACVNCHHFSYMAFLLFINFQSIKTTYNNDSNLRSHLGRAHNMAEVMFDSQRQQRAKTSHKIPTEKKHLYHAAAFECIVTDGRPFGDFRRAGMSKFLDTICPG